MSIRTGLIVLCGVLAGAPAFAASDTQTGNGSAASYAQQLVSDATSTVQQIKADHAYDDLLKTAKGVFIMPDLVKAAFVVGGQGAQGVLLKHESDGSWSNPAFLNIGAISVGAQAGGKAGPAAMFLMTDKAVNDLTQPGNFSLNANAGLTIVNASTQGQAPVGKGDIVIWSNQSGAFAGASLSGADISQDEAADQAYYGKTMATAQILASKTAPAGAERLKSALPT